MADEAKSPRSRVPGLVILGVAAVFAVAVTAYLFLGGDDNESAADDGNSFEPATTATPAGNGDLGMLTPARPDLGEPAPDFALVDARDGSVRKLSDFRGTPVLVNWYASWCGPCRDEIPEFTAMLDAVGPGAVVVLGIDYQESSSKALGILDDFDAEYPALLDSSGSVADHYRVGNRMPSSFFVDAAGVLRSMQIGVLDQDDLVEQLATIGVSYTPAE